MFTADEQAILSSVYTKLSMNTAEAVLAGAKPGGHEHYGNVTFARGACALVGLGAFGTITEGLGVLADGVSLLHGIKRRTDAAQTFEHYPDRMQPDYGPINPGLW